MPDQQQQLQPSGVTPAMVQNWKILDPMHFTTARVHRQRARLLRYAEELQDQLAALTESNDSRPEYGRNEIDGSWTDCACRAVTCREHREREHGLPPRRCNCNPRFGEHHPDCGTIRLRPVRLEERLSTRERIDAEAKAVVAWAKDERRKVAEQDAADHEGRLGEQNAFHSTPTGTKRSHQAPIEPSSGTERGPEDGLSRREQIEAAKQAWAEGKGAAFLMGDYPEGTLKP